MAMNRDLERTIWSKELAIFKGRARGDMKPYLSMVHPSFIAWPAGVAKPFSAQDFIDRNAAPDALPAGEKTTLSSTGMSVDGSMVISYFTTHRTIRPGGENVDEYFDNIHVWSEHEGQWRVVASMSRLSDSGS